MYSCDIPDKDILHAAFGPKKCNSQDTTPDIAEYNIMTGFLTYSSAVVASFPPP